MTDETEDIDIEYLNDFHREWVERLKERRASRQSITFTHEFAKAQSERLDRLIREEEERLRRERKKAAQIKKANKNKSESSEQSEHSN